MTLRARWLLVWCVLFIGAAVASPMLQPQTGERVCSALGGMKMVDVGAGDDTRLPASLDCPLCMPLAAPGPGVIAEPHPDVQAPAAHWPAKAWHAAPSSLPWQARAPPLKAC